MLNVIFPENSPILLIFSRNSSFWLKVFIGHLLGFAVLEIKSYLGVVGSEINCLKKLSIPYVSVSGKKTFGENSYIFLLF